MFIEVTAILSGYKQPMLLNIDDIVYAYPSIHGTNEEIGDLSTIVHLKSLDRNITCLISYDKFKTMIPKRPDLKVVR